MKTKNTAISKSQFLKGIQCQKSLWYYRHRKDLASQTSDSQQAVFDTGHLIGELAQKYYKNGIEVKCEYWDIDGAIKKTKEYIKDGYKVIYEATAKSELGIYSKIDILKKVAGKDCWDLIEVKGSTEVKDYYYWDMASQRVAFETSGYSIRKSVLMHINNEYVRNGDLDPIEFFTSVDCSDEVIKRMADVKKILPQFIKILSSSKEPNVDIGDHCGNPFACEFSEHCWKDIPEFSVYNLFSGSKLSTLLESDILDLTDIPRDFKMTDRQQLVVDCLKKKKTHIDVVALQEWLKGLEYPLCFLDYETVFSAIPPFDGLSPYSQLPFQYSLHVVKKKGAEAIHYEYLHQNATDPRAQLIKSLVKHIEKKGSVVAYNASFEIGVNNKLAEVFPKYKNELSSINDRMVDLLIPFREKSLYSYKQNNSASIKAVLPAFVPRMKYSDLEIKEGGTASMIGEALIHGKIADEDLDSVVGSLLEYCKMDTLAMVKLLDVIYGYVAKK